MRRVFRLVCTICFFWFVGQSTSLAQESAQTSFHDSIVVVLDASGSMEDLMGEANLTRMGAAKNALKTVLAKVPESTHVGILVFSNWQDEPWIGGLDSRESNASLFAKIDAIRPGGGTPLGQFIKLGADRLLKDREKQFGYGSYRLLVVTDGQAEDANLLRKYAPDVVSRGIAMDVIGVDMAQDHVLASHARSYRRADDEASLTQAVSEVFAEVSGDGQVDNFQEEAFELVQAFKSEMAFEIIGALANSGNHPIGTVLYQKTVDNEESQDSDTALTQKPGQGDGGCGAPSFGKFMILAFLAWWVFSGVRKKRR